MDATVTGQEQESFAATTERWRELGFRTDERIADLLERSALAWPDRVAVITAEGETTFRELQARSSAIARTLVAAGIGPSDVVCWMLPTTVDAIATAAAVWRVGAVSSPVVPVYGPREILSVIEQVRPAAVITWATNPRRDHPGEFDAALEQVGHVPRARLLTEGRSVGWVEAGSEGPGSLPTSLVGSAAQDPCLILFTSGTESAPKAAVHTPASIHHELRSTIAEWGLTFRDRMVMASPMTHITGLLQGFMIPARVGASAVLLERWDAAAGVDLIERTGATYMAGATPFLRELVHAYEAAGLSESSLRQYCCGGASVPPQLIRQVGDLGVAAYRAWGMTELPTATIANELDPLEARAETDGRLAPGVELRVVNASGEDVEPGEEGEMLLRGPEMMRGYLAPGLDGAAFTADRWFKTGDLGSLGTDGYVRISSRIKDIVNRGGEKFSVRQIEEAVARHPDVVAVAVVAVPGGRLGEQIGAAVVSSRGELTLEEVGRTVTDFGLARQKQPELLRTVETLPTNATGKIDKAALVKLLTEGPE